MRYVGFSRSSLTMSSDYVYWQTNYNSNSFYNCDSYKSTKFELLPLKWTKSKYVPEPEPEPGPPVQQQFAFMEQS